MAGSIVLNMRGGAKLHVPRAIDQITPYVLLEQDDWFEDEIRFVRAMLRPGQKAIDIGANHGVYAAAIAGAVGPAGDVWAFEPTPRTAELLAESLRPYPQARLLREAVSNTAGTAHLRVSAESESNALADCGRDGTLAVPVQTPDRLAAALGWRGIDFLKIDAEGHEAAIVEGGKAFFASESPLVMLEVAHDRSAVDLLRAQGYSAYRLLPGPLLLVPVAPGEALDPLQLNLFCCKPDRARRLADEGFLAPEPAAAPAGDEIALHRIAMERARRPEERFGALRAALELVAADAAPALPRLSSRIRIARDAGARTLAYESAKGLLAEFPRRWREAVGARFLAPLDRLDAVAAGGEELEWLACAAAEAVLELIAYSTKFAAPSLMRVISMLDGNPFRSPRTERRRQLMRMTAGLQAGPQRHPLLETACEENLNPAYWRGES